jgi:hypothetical protein
LILSAAVLILRADSARREVQQCATADDREVLFHPAQISRSELQNRFELKPPKATRPENQENCGKPLQIEI